MAVNFAVSAARVQKRAAARTTRSEVKQAAVGWRERRENDLKQMGVVIPLSDWLGHNNGPDILQPSLFVEHQWRRAQEDAFRPPSQEMGRRWARMASKLGLSWREFRLIMLEHGRHPTEEDATRIKALRGGSAGLSEV